jgi:hypothetical protein
MLKEYALIFSQFVKTHGGYFWRFAIILRENGLWLGVLKAQLSSDGNCEFQNLFMVLNLLATHFLPFIISHYHFILIRRNIIFVSHFSYTLKWLIMLLPPNLDSNFILLSFKHFLVIVGFELRALCFLGSCSTI